MSSHLSLVNSLLGAIAASARIDALHCLTLCKTLCGTDYICGADYLSLTDYIVADYIVED